MLTKVKPKFDFHREFIDFARNSFSLLHLVFHYYINKNAEDISEILNLKVFDVLMLNETFLSSSNPTPSHPYYYTLRYDRIGRSGGGLLVFIKKQIKITQIKYISSIECIQFSINTNRKNLNFLCCNKAPDFDKNYFIDQLEDLLLESDKN